MVGGTFCWASWGVGDLGGYVIKGGVGGLEPGANRVGRVSSQELIMLSKTLYKITPELYIALRLYSVMLS